MTEIDMTNVSRADFAPKVRQICKAVEQTKGNIKAAKRLVNRAHPNSDFWPIHYNGAALALAQTHPEWACDLSNSTIAEGISNSESYYYRSLIERALGREEDAGKYLERALISPDGRYHVEFCKGIEASLKDDYRTAMKAYLAALEEKPDDAKVLRRVVRTYLELGDWNRAIGFGEHLNEVEPNRWENQFALAIAHLRNGEVESTKEILDKVIEQHGKRPAFPNNHVLISAMNFYHLIANSGQFVPDYMQHLEQLQESHMVSLHFHPKLQHSADKAPDMTPEELSQWRIGSLKAICGLITAQTRAGWHAGAA